MRNAAIPSRGGLVTVLAGSNDASSVITLDLFVIGDSPAVRAIGDVVSEGRRKHTTSAAFLVTNGIDAVEAFSAGRTTHGLASGTSGDLVLPPRETLRATSAREGSAHPIALGQRWTAFALGRVFAGESRVAVLASKAAGAANATHGAGVGRVLTPLAVTLVLDKVGEVVVGFVFAKSVADFFPGRVGFHEISKCGYAKTDLKMSRGEWMTEDVDVDIQIQSNADIDTDGEVSLHVSLPRLENISGRRSIGQGAREEQRE